MKIYWPLSFVKIKKFFGTTDFINPSGATYYYSQNDELSERHQQLNTNLSQTKQKSLLTYLIKGNFPNNILVPMWYSGIKIKLFKIKWSRNETPHLKGYNNFFILKIFWFQGFFKIKNGFQYYGIHFINDYLNLNKIFLSDVCKYTKYFSISQDYFH